MTDIIDRARGYLNCDAELDKLGVTNLVAEMHDEIARLCDQLKVSSLNETAACEAAADLEQTILNLRDQLAAAQARFDAALFYVRDHCGEHHADAVESIRALGDE